jgi:nucleoside-diphosphate-sugar epimerase
LKKALSNNLKKIYITGVSGFIGSRVAKIFSENDYQVIGITRRSGPVVSRELGINVVEADLDDTNKLELEAADAIIHCATPNEVLSKNVGAGLSLSIVGTSKLLEASRNAKITNVIFFSTAQVYGTELNGYLDETTQIDCQTPYAINHYLGEKLCKYYCNTQDFNITVIRPSNIYGVPEISTVNRRTLVPMCFVEEAINFGSITLRSSGRQIRNFVSIDQVAELTTSIVEGFPKGYSIRNCGSNLYLSIMDVAYLVSDFYKKRYKKNLIINTESDEPLTSNSFVYRSKFDKFFENSKDSRNNISLIIEQLFKLFENDQK